MGGIVGSAVNRPRAHDEVDLGGDGDVLGRVSGHGDDVGGAPG